MELKEIREWLEQNAKDTTIVWRAIITPKGVEQGVMTDPTDDRKGISTKGMIACYNTVRGF